MKIEDIRKSRHLKIKWDKISYGLAMWNKDHKLHQFEKWRVETLSNLRGKNRSANDLEKRSKEWHEGFSIVFKPVTSNISHAFVEFISRIEKLVSFSLNIIDFNETSILVDLHTYQINLLNLGRWKEDSQDSQVLTVVLSGLQICGRSVKHFKSLLDTQ